MIVVHFERKVRGVMVDAVRNFVLEKQVGVKVFGHEEVGRQEGLLWRLNMRSGCDGGRINRRGSVHVSISHRVWKGQWLFGVRSRRLLLWIEVCRTADILLN